MKKKIISLVMAFIRQLGCQLQSTKNSEQLRLNFATHPDSLL